MPFLDVSDVLLDPMFAEELTIERRAEIVGPNGRATKMPKIITPKPIGVVTSQSGDLLIRNPDEQHRPNVICVHTRFRLSGPAPGREPDTVIWEGDRYTVIQVDNFSRFGAGFMSATCASTSSVDQAPR